MTKPDYCLRLGDLTADDVSIVGGKNASLGEMIRTLKQEGVRVPAGFATTAEAYWRLVEYNELQSEIRDQLNKMHQGEVALHEAGHEIRRLFRHSEFPQDVADAIVSAYDELCDRYSTKNVDVAVRSSATAEDLPQASFAGQQETFLNVRGSDDLLESCRKCYASLFTDRAIAYREDQGFDHLDVALSVGVQKMVRSDKGSAGVLFTIDTETGFPDVVVINAAWGLGETVVQGSVTPDEYRVFKPLLADSELAPIIQKQLGDKQKKLIYASGGNATTKTVETTQNERRSFVLTDEEILRLARWAIQIEKHYDHAMDIEWAKDGESDELFILQARPETVQSQKEGSSLKTYTLQADDKSERLLRGLAIGEAIASGDVCLIESAAEIDQFVSGSILATGMTDPDWVPIMKRAAGIVTDFGGRTSHAAIVSRELGIPAVVGTGEATSVLEDGQTVTMSCAEGEDGYVYAGALDYQEDEIDLSSLPETETRIMMNISSPAAAFRWWRLPCRGIGLARIEFIISNIIQVHPLALIHFDQLEDREVKRRIESLTEGYEDKSEFFVDNLSLGIARIASAQFPEPVIVRMSDFKTNEYADLIGGKEFEPEEHNPMLGFRGASRYYSDQYRAGFALECRAIKQVREKIGLTNVIVMIPFCRTLEEADRVLEVMAENELERGVNGLRVYVMAEIPANVLLATQFAQRFDGFSIGSNDLTQLTLGIDRDSTQLKELFDERNAAVREMVRMLIEQAHEANTPVGICGEAPSNYPEFAAFLVEHDIDSISLSPDSVIEVINRVAEAEQNRREKAIA